jgi:endonuclease/exonuclease/phosphatase (EEP) superfamily protein YafD
MLRVDRRIRQLIALAVVAPWLAWAIMRTFGLDRGAVLVPLVSFTPFVAATAWVPILVSAGLRLRATTVLALAAAGALFVAVVPRAVAGPRASIDGGEPLRVMTANLKIGEGDARTIVAIARRERIDVLSLQELTPDAVRRLEAAGARRRFPYQALDARGGASGTGLMSRYPLRDPQRPYTTRLAMPQAELEVPDVGDVFMKAVHPTAPLHGDVGEWQREIRGLPPATPQGQLRILAGDFNATLDHDVLRNLIATGYVDAADASGAGLHGTYPAHRRIPPAITIDHVLVDRRIRVTGVKVHSVPGSDHRAVTVSLTLPRD